MYDVPGMRISLVAKDAIAKRWLAVKFEAGVDNTMSIATAAADPVAGILQADGRAGQILPVMINGVTMWEAGAAIPAGSPVQVGANGRAVVGSASSRIGFAMTGSAAAGEIISVVLRLN